MKKFFTLIAVALIGTSAFAGVTYHEPGTKAPGTPFEYVNLSNALINNQTTEAGVTGKYGISPDYPWITYHNSSSILTTGGGEVSRGGIYVSKNPLYTYNEEFVYMVEDAKPTVWLGSPKVEVGYKKGTTYLNKLCPKTISFSVKKTTRVDILLTGGGSYYNEANIYVKDNQGNVNVVYVPTMPGKSNKTDTATYKKGEDGLYTPDGKANCCPNSRWAEIKDLDPTKTYTIIVAPGIMNAELQVQLKDEDGEPGEKVWKSATDVLGTVNFAEDIDLADDQAVCNLKTASVYVAAIHLFGEDLTSNGGKIMKAASTDCYSPVGKKYPGAAYAYVDLGKVLQANVPTTTFSNVTGDATTATDKYAVNDDYPWINYNYTASILDGKFNTYSYDYAGGKCEVSRGGYYSKFDPASGADVVTYMSYEDNGWSGTPKVEVGYTKGDNGYFNKLCPKSVSFNVKETSKVDVVLTGAGSNANYADVCLYNLETGELVKTITTENLSGKSNKPTGSASNTKVVTFDYLNPSKLYKVVVMPSATEAKLKVKTKDEDGEYGSEITISAEKLLGSKFDFSNDIELNSKDTVVTDVVTAAVSVLALRVYEELATAHKDLETIIRYEIANGRKEVSLNKNIAYTLGDASKTDYAAAKTDYTEFTIKGNGATITASGKGQIQTKKSLTIDNVVLDASASTVAPIAMAPAADMATAADSAACYTYTKDETGAYTVAKYTGAQQKVFEAQLVSLTNSTVKTASSLFDGSQATWAIRNLIIDNSEVYTTGTCIYMNRTNCAIQHLTVNNSTIADAKNNTNYFVFGTNKTPDQIWGTADAHNYLTATNCTFVNHKDFVNSYSNNNKTTVELRKNIFANYKKIHDAIGNCNIIPEDSVKILNVKSANADDAYATLDNDMNVFYTADGYQFAAAAGSYAYNNLMGDPRWITDNQKVLAPLYAEVATANAMLTQYSDYSNLEEYDVLKSEVAVACDMIDQPTAPTKEEVNAEIEKLQAAEKALEAAVKEITGISTVEAAAPANNNGRAYNLAGQRVNANAKGIVIINGKKYMNK